MAQDTDDINLTPQELQILSELDSRQFGFLKLNSPEQTKKKALVVRAIKYLERMLVQAQAEKQRRKADSTKMNPDELKDDDEDKGISIDPKTYCKLGHFHLLLEDYSKAMSAYQKFYSLKGDYWKDASFLYGQGLVYYHFNAFQCLKHGKFIDIGTCDVAICGGSALDGSVPPRAVTSLGSGASRGPMDARHVIACLRSSETASHVTSPGTTRHSPRVE